MKVPMIIPMIAIINLICENSGQVGKHAGAILQTGNANMTVLFNEKISKQTHSIDFCNTCNIMKFEVQNYVGKS